VRCSVVWQKTPPNTTDFVVVSLPRCTYHSTAYRVSERIHSHKELHGRDCELIQCNTVPPCLASFATHQATLRRTLRGQWTSDGDIPVQNVTATGEKKFAVSSVDSGNTYRVFLGTEEAMTPIDSVRGAYKGHTDESVSCRVKARQGMCATLRYRRHGSW